MLFLIRKGYYQRIFIIPRIIYYYPNIMGRYQALIKEEYTEPRFQTSEEIHEAKEDKRALGDLTDTAPAYRKLKIA